MTMLCLIDEQGRTLKDRSITELTLQFMKHEGLSSVKNMSGGRLNSTKYLHELMNRRTNNCEIIFLSDDIKPYKLDNFQKQKLLPFLAHSQDSLSGRIIKTLLQDEGVLQI